MNGGQAGLRSLALTKREEKERKWLISGKLGDGDSDGDGDDSDIECLRGKSQNNVRLHAKAMC